MPKFNIPLIVIAGPTGVGKTHLSIQLAQHFDGEIINGDSMQVYKSLDIGTGKVTTEETQGIPHHLLDIKSVEETYDASQFRKDAHKQILDIHQRDKLPILVGGTGLYIEGLLYDLEFGHSNSHNTTLRKSIEQRGERIGSQALWQELHQQDPVAAAKIPHQNMRRTIRALEVIAETGELFSSQERHQTQSSRYNECLLILDRPREVLYQRINQRVIEMQVAGLVQEAKALYNINQEQSFQSTKGIGYKEWWPFFEGEISEEEALARIQQNSRRYAKRQLTWFRNRFLRKHWLEVQTEEQVLAKAIEIIHRHITKEKRN